MKIHPEQKLHLAISTTDKKLKINEQNVPARALISLFFFKEDEFKQV